MQKEENLALEDKNDRLKEHAKKISISSKEKPYREGLGFSKRGVRQDVNGMRSGYRRLAGMLQKPV